MVKHTKYRVEIHCFLRQQQQVGKNQKYVAQPFSDELAHPRRFALKPAFVTTLLKKESYLVEEEITPPLVEEEITPPLVEEEITSSTNLFN